MGNKLRYDTGERVTKMKVYYAHHMWKYGTKIEEYEMALIAQRFPEATIFNPAVGIPKELNEEEAMKLCLSEVESSDALVFSSVDGVVGRGVYTETLFANTRMPVLYIHNNELLRMGETDSLTILEHASNRIYATVGLGMER